MSAWKEILCPLHRMLRGPQGRSGCVLKISHPPEFYSRTSETVASRYTDYSVAAHTLTSTIYNVLQLEYFYYNSL